MYIIANSRKFDSSQSLIGESLIEQSSIEQSLIGESLIGESSIEQSLKEGEDFEIMLSEDDKSFIFENFCLSFFSLFFSISFFYNLSYWKFFYRNSQYPDQKGEFFFLSMISVVFFLIVSTFCLWNFKNIVIAFRNFKKILFTWLFLFFVTFFFFVFCFYYKFGKSITGNTRRDIIYNNFDKLFKEIIISLFVFNMILCFGNLIIKDLRKVYLVLFVIIYISILIILFFTRIRNDYSEV